jgi:hypothetical protein
MAKLQGARALSGGRLVAAITSVCSSGFLLFGYDQGVMSGVVISKYWLEQMGHPSQLMVGTITALVSPIPARLLGYRSCFALLTCPEHLTLSVLDTNLWAIIV